MTKLKKLHLGCGEDYLEGYVNIDFPLTHHSVQHTSVADTYADITKLHYPEGSIDEIRLHHVFEHFPRATAVALIFSWNSWLKTGGKLVIEVPDFNKMARIALSPFVPEDRRYLAHRHMFGSQEAAWAIHYAGWSKPSLHALTDLAGFTGNIESTQSHTYLYNLLFTGIKTKQLTKQSAKTRAKAYLSQYLVDSSATEKNMLREWIKQYDEQIIASWGK